MVDISIARNTGNVYCLRNKCYTYTQLTFLGLGATVIGVIVGIVGISWLKHQCYLTEYKDIPEEGKDIERKNDSVRELVNDPDIDSLNDEDNLEFEDERTEISDKNSQKIETDL
jgi:hypothetical protein